jgi:hypothetical protein
MSSYLDDNYLLGSTLGADSVETQPPATVALPQPAFFESTVNVPGVGPVKIKTILLLTAVAGFVWWYMKKRKSRK